MSKPKIRSSQLIRTFGPGAMADFPEDAVIIAGTDSWRYHRSQPMPAVTEPRLQQKVAAFLEKPGVTFRKPPHSVEEDGFTPDIGGFRFPEWFIVQNPKTTSQGYRARLLVPGADLDKGRFRDDDGKKYPVVPVRFVRACPRGHVGDINWHAFVHGSDKQCKRELVLEERGTSGDLDSVWVRCACGHERVMSQAARMELRALGSCDGSRPWLGRGTKESCGNPNRLLIRSASNAYFSQAMSLISIPDSHDEVTKVVRSLWESHLSIVQNADQLKFVMQMPAVKERLGDFAADQIMATIERIRQGAADTRPIKEAEFEALTEAKEELGSDEPGGDFFARALSECDWKAPWMNAIERVILVHRLREVIAQVGFTRFEAAGPDIQGELDIEVKTAPLGIDTDWVPAVENRGEGIFLQFNPQDVNTWLIRPEVMQRKEILKAGFQSWLGGHEGSRRQFPGLAFYMLHTLSHMLLTAISLECGYPASSLRERVYAANGSYGILILTGSPDAEGTLGGLVDEGRRIKYHMQSALELARLCSNDPICAFHSPHEHDHQPLLGSACHGCILISETSCEQRNDFLDRSLVVSTVECLGAEFFR